MVDVVCNHCFDGEIVSGSFGFLFCSNPRCSFHRLGVVVRSVVE